MELSIVTKILFEEHKDSNFLITDKLGQIHVGVIQSLALNEKGEPCVYMGKTKRAFSYRGVRVADISKIEHIETLFDKDNLILNEEIPMNNLICELLTKSKDTICFEVLLMIKDRLAYNTVKYTMDDVVEVEEPKFIEGEVIGIHDIEIRVKDGVMDFDAILEIATSDGVKSVRLKDIEVMY